MNENRLPEPNSSLSPKELQLGGHQVLQKAKITAFKFPGFQAKWDEIMTTQTGTSIGFLDLQCFTVDERDASIAYLKTPTLEQIEIRVFHKSVDQTGYIRPGTPMQREAVFAAFSQNSKGLEAASSVVYERGLSEPDSKSDELCKDSNTAVAKSEEALARMGNARPMFDVIDEIANRGTTLTDALKFLSDRLGLSEPALSAEELIDQLPPLNPEDYEEIRLSDDEVEEVIENFERREKQTKMKMDWNPDFMKRWKILFDGLDTSQQ